MNRKGFSLVEVILSVAAVSMLSIFILQMFIIAADSNLQAKNQDVAFVTCSNIIEEVKARENYLEAMNYLSTFSKDNQKYEIYLTNDWIIVDRNSADEPAFIISIVTDIKSHEAGTLLELQFLVSLPLEAERALYTLEGSKYFPDNSSNGFPNKFPATGGV